MRSGSAVRPLRLVALACAAVLGSAAVPPASATGARSSVGNLSPHPPPRLTVPLDLRHAGAPVPQDFIGLSFETSSLPLISRYAHEGDLVALVRSLGPGIMRFGGISADWTTWAAHAPGEALWPATRTSAEDLAGLGTLARTTNWRVLVGVDLAHYDPQAAASEVTVAHSQLGARLAGIELGNEPDAYGTDGLRGLPWGFAQYGVQIGAYRQLIEAAAPGVGLAGPDVSGPGGGSIDGWMLPEALEAHASMLTGHYYSLGCHDAAPPTIERLLSPRTTRAMQAALGAYSAASRATAIPLRVDEANTVSCGGQAGVSNTFASALWATDFLVRAMAAGLAGVNLHGHLESCSGYAPLCAPSEARLLAGDLRVQPEWYALLLVRPLLGDRPLGPVAAPRRSAVDVASFRSPSGTVHVVIIDTAPRGPDVRIRLPGSGRFTRAGASTLAAPSCSSTSDTTINGRAVAGDGVWRGPRARPLGDDGAGGFALEVAPCSATLITLSPKRAA